MSYTYISLPIFLENIRLLSSLFLLQTYYKFDLSTKVYNRHTSLHYSINIKTCVSDI